VGLPASQRRILEKIEHALRGSDPRLTSLFAIFSRLTRDEEMPAIEQLRALAALLPMRLHRGLRAAGHRLRARSPGRRKAAVFFPLALVIVASTFVVAAAMPASTRCAAAAAAVAARRNNARVRTCKPVLVGPVFRGK
jgi:predicted transcriptional regulator